jgi:hypothetical protein
LGIAGLGVLAFTFGVGCLNVDNQCGITGTRDIFYRDKEEIVVIEMNIQSGGTP